MARRVKISVVGPRPPAGDPGTGQAAVDAMIDFWRAKLDQVLPESPDLVVVPETCDMYPTHSIEDRLLYHAAREDQVLDFFSETARINGCYLTYPALREAGDGTWRNSLRLIGRDGETVGIYDKNHPTISEIEQDILPGTEAPIFDCDFGSVGGAICFDLNFDRLRKQYAAARPDLVLFSSVYHGGLMQGYWAYSCRAHLVAAIGTTERVPSAIVSPTGENVATTTNYFDHATATVNLDCALVHLDYNRPALEEMRRKYGADVSVVDPGYLGSVLVSSESDDRTVDDLVAEFDLEPLDDYFTRSLEERSLNTRSLAERDQAAPD